MGSDIVVPKGEVIKADIILTRQNGEPEKTEVFTFTDGGVFMGMYNTDEVLCDIFYLSTRLHVLVWK